MRMRPAITAQKEAVRMSPSITMIPAVPDHFLQTVHHLEIQMLLRYSRNLLQSSPVKVEIRVVRAVKTPRKLLPRRHQLRNRLKQVMVPVRAAEIAPEKDPATL